MLSILSMIAMRYAHNILGCFCCNLIFLRKVISIKDAQVIFIDHMAVHVVKPVPSTQIVVRITDNLTGSERDMEIPFENPCPGQANGLPAYYFTQAVHMLLASHCMLGNPEDYPKNFDEAIEDNVNFDFIIVGGGSAGSVVATRLSEVTKWRVLLIEAGENPTFESDIPAFSLSLPGRSLDWNFATNKSEKSCLGMEDEICAVFQGKVLGGSSSINKMHYLRGSPEDFEEWKAMGSKEWGYEEVLKYYKKSERLDEDFNLVKADGYEETFNTLKQQAGRNERKLHELSKTLVGKYHSKAGMLSVNHFAYNSFLNRIKLGLFGAAEELNIPYIADPNGKSQIGYARVMGAIHEGNRGNTAKAFLTRFKDRKNLFVLKNATVHKLIIDDKKVKGVTLKLKEKLLTVLAKKEVIVSAGAVNSPRLLLLSGIGPSHHLEKIGINVVKNLPGVGQNLQAHLTFFGFPVAVDKNKSNPITHLQKIDAMYQFISRGTGFFGSINLNDVVGFINTAGNRTAPDILFYHYLNHIRDYYTFNELLISIKIKNEIRDQFAKAYAKSNVLLVCPTILKPKSRGRIELTGPGFKDSVKIVSNFLQEQEDVDSLVEGIRFATKLIHAKAFKEFEPELLKLDIEDCKGLKFDTYFYWECLIRHLASSMHDLAGTCKMGVKSDSLAVVDERLKVYGLQGLRIADSSIMPTIVRGSTSIASVMIGERVADFIKEDWKKMKHEEL